MPPERAALIGQVIHTRALAHVADVQTDPRASELARQFAVALGYRTVLLVPLLRDDECLGCSSSFARPPNRLRIQRSRERAAVHGAAGSL